jgi:hypothetical protein
MCVLCVVLKPGLRALRGLRVDSRGRASGNMGPPSMTEHWEPPPDSQDHEADPPDSQGHGHIQFIERETHLKEEKQPVDSVELSGSADLLGTGLVETSYPGFYVRTSVLGLIEGFCIEGSGTRPPPLLGVIF